jgi:opacity protein-like surface antigen
MSVSAGTIKDDAVGINLGATATKVDKSIKLDNFSVGVTYQFNQFSDSHLKPRVDVDYVKMKEGSMVNGLYKGSVNGVYEFAVTKKLSPYVVAGVGYEHVDGPVEGVFESHPFSQAGAGVSYRPGDGYNVQVESRLLQIHSGHHEENEVIVTAGLSIPVGNLDTNDCPVKIDGPDQDRDGVLDSVDQCPNIILRSTSFLF